MKAGWLSINLIVRRIEVSETWPFSLAIELAR
jgi:hypothetical protein